MQVTVEMTGLPRLEAAANALDGLQMERRFGLMRELGQMIKLQHVRRILSEKRSPDGAAWAPLKASTVKRKGNGNILVESGAMAWGWHLDITGERVLMRNTAKSRRGEAVLYLPFHQYGTSKMVARPPMGFSVANIAEIMRRVESWVSGRIMSIAA